MCAHCTFQYLKGSIGCESNVVNTHITKVLSYQFFFLLEPPMLNNNTAYDTYDGTNKVHNLLELTVIIRRALLLRSLRETFRNIINLLVTRIIPNAIPGLIVFVVLPRVFHFDPIFSIDPQQMVLKYGHKISAKYHGVLLLLYSIISVLDMLLRGLTVFAVQYVFWFIFQRKPSRGDTGPRRPSGPSKGRRRLK